MRRSGKHLQRLQSPYTCFRRDQTSQERYESRARLAKACNPTNATSEKPVRQNTSRVAHDDRVHRA